MLQNNKYDAVTWVGVTYCLGHGYELVSQVHFRCSEHFKLVVYVMFPSNINGLNLLSDFLKLDF